MIIAIDGIAASGKGTLSEFLAKHYKCEILPTGNLYRLTAKYLIDKNVDVEQMPESSLSKDLMTMLRHPEFFDANLNNSMISAMASKIAKEKIIRDILTEFQKKWIQKRKTAVVEGRDIGTVVWPQAEVKLFLVADAEIRARRRAKQLHGIGSSISEKDIYDGLIERDQRDKMREMAPMKMAKDAIFLDTTNLTVEEMQAKAVSLIEKKIDNYSGKV